jgi:hypothetical protein
MNAKEYIVYTPEGMTIAPNDKCVVENYQVLGVLFYVEMNIKCHLRNKK